MAMSSDGCPHCGNKSVSKYQTKCSFCGKELPQILPSSNAAINLNSNIAYTFKAKLSNPTLAQIKAFLSGLEWVKSKRYQPPFSVCTHFSMDVVDAATQRNMRCACAIIYFNSYISHSIIAFSTDDGFIFAEPQSCEIRNIEVGLRYPYELKGMPTDIRVLDIELFWNDNVMSSWNVCEDCGYVLPTKEWSAHSCNNDRSIHTYLRSFNISGNSPPKPSMSQEDIKELLDSVPVPTQRVATIEYGQRNPSPLRKCRSCGFIGYGDKLKYHKCPKRR
jgi:hypothetical protein